MVVLALLKEGGADMSSFTCTAACYTGSSPHPLPQSSAGHRRSLALRRRDMASNNTDILEEGASTALLLVRWQDPLIPHQQRKIPFTLSTITGENWLPIFENLSL